MKKNKQLSPLKLFIYDLLFLVLFGWFPLAFIMNLIESFPNINNVIEPNTSNAAILITCLILILCFAVTGIALKRIIIRTIHLIKK